MQGSNLKVIRDIQLTGGQRLTSPFVSGMGSYGNCSGRSLTPGQKEPSRATNECLSSGVLSGVKDGYQYLEVCGSNLVKYLGFLKVTHDYGFTG